MKRLITAQDIQKAKAEHRELVVSKGTIVTALAEDLAHELGVQIVREGEKTGSCESGICGANGASVQPLGHATGKQLFDAEEIYQLLNRALEAGILTEDIFRGVLPTGNAQENADLRDGLVPVGVSGRHVHLSKKDLETLFGAGYQLTQCKALSQPGQYAAKETVTLCGPKGTMEGVRVLGPVRDKTQVELLASDTFKLGVKAPNRLSGELSGSAGITLVGPKGSVTIPEGVIVAQRHLHMSMADAKALDVRDGDVISVEIQGERGGLLANVKVRANDSSALDLHLDMDEANALGLSNGDKVKIIK